MSGSDFSDSSPTRAVALSQPASGADADTKLGPDEDACGAAPPRARALSASELGSPLRNLTNASRAAPKSSDERRGECVRARVHVNVREGPMRSSNGRGCVCECARVSV